MKLSIITICYNEPNLEQTCESIVNQTWQDFEWIVIDGGSNQATQEIWNKYKYRIDKFISEPDNGRYNAMNKGIRLATGEYLNFLNAGDYYANNDILQKVLSFNLNKDIVFGDLNLVEQNGKVSTWKIKDEIDAKYLYYSSLPHPSSFIKRNLFDTFGLYNEGYQIVSDWEKFIDMLVIHKSSYKHINLPCAYFKLDGISSVNKAQEQKERNDVLKKYFTTEQINQFLPKHERYSFFEHLFSIKNSLNKTHKIITILGLHIKIRRKNK